MPASVDKHGLVRPESVVDMHLGLCATKPYALPSSSVRHAPYACMPQDNAASTMPGCRSGTMHAQRSAMARVVSRGNSRRIAAAWCAVACSRPSAWRHSSLTSCAGQQCCASASACQLRQLDGAISSACIQAVAWAGAPSTTCSSSERAWANAAAVHRLASADACQIFFSGSCRAAPGGSGGCFRRAACCCEPAVLPCTPAPAARRRPPAPACHG